MASSRIFVKGLPPTFTEGEFRKHFAQNRDITDAKIFPNRRIGYVGFKTTEDAQKAVKYFNKTFIRMSRIGVELARPIQDSPSAAKRESAPTAQRVSKANIGAGEEDQLKRKRSYEKENEGRDPKLREFLEVMKPKSKKKDWTNAEVLPGVGDEGTSAGNAILAENASDEDYEEVPKDNKRTKRHHEAAQPITGETEQQTLDQNDELGLNVKLVNEASQLAPVEQHAVSDADWARSRTSRLFGLLEEEDEADARGDREGSSVSLTDDSEVVRGAGKSLVPAETGNTIPTPPMDDIKKDSIQLTANTDTEDVRSSMRLFVRNLPYDVQPEFLEAEFAAYGNLEEIHVPLDTKSGSAKGFAYIQFSDPSSAETAMSEKDGQTFQGRLLHILPARTKRETKLDDFALSKLPLKKQQQIKRRREASSTTFNWNALYMNADAVVSSVADRLGLSKSEVLDPTNSDAAIKQAHAETHIIQETKTYFRQQGVDLDAFKKSLRGDTAILIKNIPYDCSRDELRRLFEEHGELKRFLMPPSGTIAIVEYANAAQCRAAFAALAYRKIKSSVLFLEKAPKGVFDARPKSAVDPETSVSRSRTAASDLKNTAVSDIAGVATLFVRNLNFSTTTDHLTEIFKPLDGFLSARVKTKTDPKKPGQILSMGFGFLEFRSSQQAQAALQALDGYNLEGHKLQIRASHKGVDAAEERRRADAERKVAGRRSKIIIKNLPFEATKKDVRALFGAYGQLRSVRVPKKMDRAARGFGFADFTTPKEAESAMDALKDTHLLGRRLVLDFAAEDAEDAEAEIEKMQQKVGAQINKVAIQKLTSGGRKKFSTQNEDEELA